jgi:membrane associated rhomboid family serine protease
VFPLKDNIPTDRAPVVTLLLIAANVVVYFLLQDGGLGLPQDGTAGAWPVEDYAARACDFTGPCPAGAVDGGEVSPIASVFTSMFMHGSILHLAGNMLFLWIFGNNVEDSMGPVKYLGFYLLGGIAAFALQTAITPESEGAARVLGASGAVSAVIGGYILLHPKARIVTLIFIVFFVTLVELPALLVLGFWFLQQVLFGYFDLVDPAAQGGGVAYFAHIGGFVFGLALIRAFATRSRDPAPQVRW